MASTSRDNGPASPAGRGTTAADAAVSGVSRRRMPPVWVFFILLGVVNFAVSRLLLPAPTSITIPYSVFKAQVEAGNVEVVTSAGDSITGQFRTAVTYPAAAAATVPDGTAPATPPAASPDTEGASRTSRQFDTQRPAFADQDLERRLDAKGVVVEAVDKGGSSWWFNVLLGFGPTLLPEVVFRTGRRPEQSAADVQALEPSHHPPVQRDFIDVEHLDPART